MSEHLEELTLTALVLVLAKQIKAEKKAKGLTSTDDFTREAADLIKKRHHDIIALLR